MCARSSTSNGDGIGDFPGLTSRLDHIADLGATAVWLLPFYPSPLRDDGYDIADYKAVNPVYGTLDDFRAFVAAAHARGLRVIIELVVNHTSDQHPWFQRARRAPPGSPERDFYVWSDTGQELAEARIHFPEAETSNWAWDPVARAYYWHRFFAHQPDLNFDNPACWRRWRASSTSGWTRAWTASASTPCRTWSSARAPTARTCPRPTRCCGGSGRRWSGATRTASCSPRRTSRPSGRSPTSGAATSATWPSTSPSCRACSWRCRGRTPAPSSRSWSAPSTCRRAASGRSSCATTTSWRSPC